LFALISIGALFLQTITTGWAGFAGAAERVDLIGAICHGNADPGSQPPPPADHEGHDFCCVGCGPSLALLPAPAALPVRQLRPTATPPCNYSPLIAVIPGAIRAGRSQAPPSLA